MKSIAMLGVGEVAVVESSRPQAPSPGQVAIDIEGSALGQTQLHIVAGRTHQGPLPRILGHEMVGWISDVGRGVDHRLVGTRIVVNAIDACGQCRQCSKGQTSVCPNRRYLGMDSDGGWTETVVVAAAATIPISGAIPLEHALFLASAVPSAVHAVRRAGVTLGDHVLVLGLGTIGSLLGQVARALGAAQVVGGYSHARSGTALPGFSRLVDLTSPPTGSSISERLTRSSGAPWGFDVGLEASGDVGKVKLALETIRAGGSVLAMGLAAGAAELRFSDYNRDFALREVKLLTTYAYTADDIEGAIDLYMGGAIDLGALSAGTVTPEDVPSLLRSLASGGTQGKRFAIRFAPSR